VEYVRYEPTHPATTSRNRRHCSVSPLSGRSNSSGTRAAPCESQHVSVAAANVVDHAPVAIAGNAPTPEIPARSAPENDTEACIHAGSAPVGEDEVPLSQVFRIARTHSHATAHVSFTHPTFGLVAPYLCMCSQEWVGFCCWCSHTMSNVTLHGRVLHVLLALRLPALECANLEEWELQLGPRVAIHAGKILNTHGDQT
jgi:hypothetical protein